MAETTSDHEAVVGDAKQLPLPSPKKSETKQWPAELNQEV